MSNFFNRFALFVWIGSWSNPSRFSVFLINYCIPDLELK